MSDTSRFDALNDFLSALFGPSPTSALDYLERWTGEHSTLDATMLRLAALTLGNETLSFIRLNNLWHNHNRPALKPQPVPRKLLLLTDFTSQPLVPLLTIMCAARGVHVDITLSNFDSVEQDVLDPGSRIYAEEFGTIVLWLSPHWLRRYFGTGALVTGEHVEQVTGTLDSLIATLASRSGASIMVANFAAPAVSLPAGQVRARGLMGCALATGEVNRWLAHRADTRVSIVDVATSTFEAGGRSALGLSGHLRARMAMEPAGQVAAARECASALAQLCGKGHRAIVTDWDNTLWGGEVADAGREGIVCGADTPEGRGYHLVQQFMKGLAPLGVLLAAASRNDPEVVKVFNGNDNFALSLDDFAAMSVDLGAKSAAIERLSADLGFGTDYMVYVDDSLFDLAEVLRAHPFIDIVRAGPEPETTLERLTGPRFFNAVSLSEEDLRRTEAAGALKAQRVLRAAVGTLDDFLGQIAIQVSATPMSEGNGARIEQLLHKTNQFNLTTRRYSRADLQRLQGEGARVTAFTYQDAFGSQGIIAVVILRESAGAIHIDTWLMSCRVLNRTVELAVFDWIRQQANGAPIIGEFRPTEKNGLVRDLYARLGFQRVDDEGGDHESWRFAGFEAGRLPPTHFVEFTEVSIS